MLLALGVLCESIGVSPPMDALFRESEKQRSGEQNEVTEGEVIKEESQI